MISSRVYLIFSLIIIGILFISGCVSRETPTKTPAITQPPAQELPEQPEIEEVVQPGYKYVTENPAGWFKTGQEADIVLYATGFNESGGPTVLNHPTKIATDGKRLIVSDTWNHRVLIWNEIPIKNNQHPDLVLGQPDFDSNMGGLSKDGLNWPMGVATDGTKLLVADAGNDRVLIWNEFPTRNGQAADLVLGAPDFDHWARYLDWEAQKEKKPSSRDPKKEINWPWDVWTDGNRVVVLSTTDSSVLIWNSFPTQNNQPADIILGHPDFNTRFRDTSEIPDWPIPFVSMTTPRSIASDGNYLAIGMYGSYGMYVWKEFPNKNGQPADFIMELRRLPDEPPGMVAGLTINNGKLFAASTHQVFIWNSLPLQETQKEDLRIGRLDPSLERDGLAGPEGVATNGERLFVADTYQNRVLIFNRMPIQNGVRADLILGQPDFGVNIFSSRNSFPNPFPYSDGRRLFVCSDSRQGLAIYNYIPDESKAEADVIIKDWKINQREGELGDCGQVTSDGTKMIVAARGSGKVLIWNTIPAKDNELPDVILGNTTDLTQHWHGGGRYSFNSPVGVTTDGKKLFVSDRDNNRILIWNEIPKENQKSPDLVLGQPDFETYNEGDKLNNLFHPVQISTDGKRLAVADQFNNRILIWKELPTKNQQPADFAIKRINHSKELADSLPTAQLSMPAGVYIFNESLFVADGGNNRVLVWSKFPENEFDEPDKVVGQPDFESQYRTNSKNILFMPHFISFDGSFLWVGEMKFSNRLLRFSVQQTKVQNFSKENEISAEKPKENITELQSPLKEYKETISSLPKLFSWQKETGIRIPNAVSSSTIFRDNGYWMYYTGRGIELAISADGADFVLKGTVIQDDGLGSNQEMVTNPAVFQLKDGKYRLIYEGSKDRQSVRKLYSAVSDDGLKWTKESGVRLEDSIFFSDPKKGSSGNVIFTSVPDVIRLENDCLRLYYTVVDESRTAISCDEGLSWKKEGKMMFDIYPDVVQDPDIILLEDGTYKLFFSTQDSQRTKQWILSASSEDGINFKMEEGKRIDPSSGKTRAVDPDVVKLPNGTYRMYYGESSSWENFNIMSAVGAN